MVIAVTLAGAILVAMTAENLLELFQYIISVPAIFGASIWLGFVWRRVTKWAVIWQVAICILLYAAIPDGLPGHRRRAPPPGVAPGNRAAAGLLHGARHARRRGRRPGLARRRPRRPVADRAAHRRLLREGRARGSGQPAVAQGRPRAIPRRAVGDELVRRRLHALDQAATGRRAVLLRRPLPVPRAGRRSRGSRARNRARRSTGSSPRSTRRCRPRHEAELAALEAAYANPSQFDADKVFRAENWEILKPARSDYIGFFGTWALVGRGHRAALGDGDGPMSRDAPARRRRVGLDNYGLFPLDLSPLDTSSGPARPRRGRRGVLGPDLDVAGPDGRAVAGRSSAMSPAATACISSGAARSTFPAT